MSLVRVESDGKIGKTQWLLVQLPVLTEGKDWDRTGSPMTQCGKKSKQD